MLLSLGLINHDSRRVPPMGCAFLPQRPGAPLACHVYYGNIQNMIDLAQITGFDWDEGNARKSADKHGVRQSEAEQVFFNQPLLLVEDTRHSQDEPRYHALGITDDHRQLHITFTLRAAGTLIRVISARAMHRKERSIYEQNQDDA